MENKMIKNFTLQEIKEAFWRTFHESGEIYFDYLSDDENNNRSTEEEWEDFLEELKKED